MVPQAVPVPQPQPQPQLQPQLRLQPQSQPLTGSPLVSVVVPAYCEVDNIRELVLRVGAALESAGVTYEVIIVDDNSQDGTDEVVQILELEGHPIRLITRVGERGLSTAVLRGFDVAQGTVLVCMDADLSHPPEKLPEMIRRCTEQQADFVIGSRYVAGGGTDAEWGWFRWLNSRVATLLARPFSSARDPLAGFFALPRDVYRRAAELDPVGYKIGLELMVKADCTNVQEVPIQFADRQHGASKLSVAEQMRYLYHLKKLADYRYTGWSQLLQFCLVGASGMLVDLTCYLLLLRSGAVLPLARALGIFAAMTWNFVLNDRITFARRATGRLAARYGRFVGSCALGGALSWAISVLTPALVPWFREHLMLAALVGIAAGTVVNFQLSRHWVFRGD
ncbi:MAG: glycosyltransferase family 2 protein [Planctomycetaceae bacterium]|nr:glycosyltransferase family 2 protein [Planctomycetaceae bacterium]